MEYTYFFPILNKKKTDFFLCILYNKYIIMNSHTYEMYDYNEYFIKFKSIHPQFHYVIDDYNIQKKKFQINLLKKLKNNDINEKQFIDIYSLLIKKENLKYTYISNLKLNHNEIIKTEENFINDEIINFMDFIL